jgi:hypothetical protein
VVGGCPLGAVVSWKGERMKYLTEIVRRLRLVGTTVFMLTMFGVMHVMSKR